MASIGPLPVYLNVDLKKKIKLIIYFLSDNVGAPPSQVIWKLSPALGRWIILGVVVFMSVEVPCDISLLSLYLMSY